MNVIYCHVCSLNFYVDKLVSSVKNTSFGLFSVEKDFAMTYLQYFLKLTCFCNSVVKSAI